MTWLALDIGGANLKAADGHGYAATRPFALWRAPQRLSHELAALIAQAPASDSLAVTMTGELADCYETKAAGVCAILEAVSEAAEARPVAVYLTNGDLVNPEEARERPLLAAASNWHALASYANRFVPQWPAILLDMGSTTADVIPLGANGPCPQGRTDPERLASSELVYQGVERTPVSAIIRRLPSVVGESSIASEYFASVGDAYLLLGEMPEEPENYETADGRQRTRSAAHARMARMLCADVTAYPIEKAVEAASCVKAAQLGALARAVRAVGQRLAAAPRTLLLSGHGEFLLRRLVDRLPWSCEVISLSSKLGPHVSRCAPAHAVAVLAQEHFKS